MQSPWPCGMEKGVKGSGSVASVPGITMEHPMELLRNPEVLSMNLAFQAVTKVYVS